MKIKKGDKVRIIAGKDKGREGVIERVYPKDDAVLIMGVNLFRKHIKKSDKMPQGGIVDVPRPLRAAKVMFVCPKCSKPSRLGYRLTKEGKIRICKKCQSVV